MDLAGNLASISLTSIFQLLCEDRKTGTLRVKSPGQGECQVVFFEGEIVYATRPFHKDLLGERLMEDGHITEKDLQRFLSLAKARKQALGKCLVQEGVITEETLARYLSQQIEDFLFYLMGLSEGTFEYSDNPPNLNWLQIVPMKTAGMILAAAARADEAAAAASPSE